MTREHAASTRAPGRRLRMASMATPLGWLALVASERGLVALAFGDTAEEAEQAVSATARVPSLPRDEAGLADWMARLQAYFAGDLVALAAIPVDIQGGTAFQRQVWEMLRAIPAGQTRTYGELARQLGKPEATRAVAHACAVNPLAVVTPCHRVVRSDGGLGGYRWGLERKRALLALECGEPRQQWLVG